MVIVHSYVSLPEGMGKMMGNYENYGTKNMEN